MAQEGVLGRTSCRSWVSWACWGGLRAVERQPTPSAGSVRLPKLARDGILGVMGTWESAGVLPGISAVLHCPWDADCSCASIWVAASRRYGQPAWRPRPRGTTEDHLNVERGQGKMVRTAVRGREGGRKMPQGWLRSCPLPR